MAAARLRHLLATLLLLAGGVAGADAGEDAALRQAERRGAEIYRADRAAWMTTDLLIAQHVVDRVPGKPVGWLTRHAGGDVWEVQYISEFDGELVAFAEGTVDFATAEPLASLRENDVPRPLDSGERLQLRVRADALGRDFLTCGGGYNTVVLPGDGGGWLVYLMPPQQTEGEYPMGGFHRMTYAADGAFVAQYAHTRGCLTQGNPDGDADFAIAGLMVSHLTSPLPNEIHVFMNLAYGLPVMTSMSDRRLWKIEDGHIAPLEP